MADMLRQGQVSERDVNDATARVAMDDLDGTVSGKLQVLFPPVGGWNFNYTPDEGDHVVMIRQPNGKEEGYVVGAVYTGNKMPQKGKPGVFQMVSKDGKNVIEFDSRNGTLNVIVDQDGTLKFKNLDIEVNKHTHTKTKTLHSEVEENAKIEVGTDVATDIGGNVDTNIGGDKYTGIGGNSSTDVSGKVNVDAGNDINLTTGGKFLLKNSSDDLCDLLVGIIDCIINYIDVSMTPTHPLYILSILEPFKLRIKRLLKGG